MPLVRRIIEVGKTSKGVILPKSWLDLLEKKHGKVEAVTMEVNGQLIIKPILSKEKEPEK